MHGTWPAIKEKDGTGWKQKVRKTLKKNDISDYKDVVLSDLTSKKRDIVLVNLFAFGMGVLTIYLGTCIVQELVNKTFEHIFHANITMWEAFWIRTGLTTFFLSPPNRNSLGKSKMDRATELAVFATIKLIVLAIVYCYI